MPITIAICDDEKNMRESIAHLVSSQCKDCRVDLYDTGNALLAANNDYDIYFLDIQMPGINGMQVAEQIREAQEAQSKNESIVIFITALKEYLEAAFDVKAFHYLIKPVDENKFNTIFSRAVTDCLRAKEGAERHILIKSGKAYYKLFHKDIYYVESLDKKVIINSTGGVTEYYGKMQDVENTLGDTFFRCHRCYIVNMRHITRYDSSTVQLKNGEEVLLAKKKYPDFVKAYMRFTMT